MFLSLPTIDFFGRRFFLFGNGKTEIADLFAKLEIFAVRVGDQIGAIQMQTAALIKDFSGAMDLCTRIKSMDISEEQLRSCNNIIDRCNVAIQVEINHALAL